MNARNFGLGVAALIVLAAPVPRAHAERVRFHFAPADLCGSTVQAPAGKCNAIGERVSYFGLGNTPYSGGLRPTYLVTFRHPATNRSVTVPLALPEGTPRLEYRANRLIYNYGIYTVDVVFLADGSVDAVYDSGPFRPLQ